MAKARVTATDRLSNVMEVVQMGRRSGLLSVERGAGSVFEVGEIYFVSGSPSYASLAGLSGREALVALSHWGPCRFAFDGDAARPAANITPADPPVSGKLSGTPVSSPPTAGSYSLPAGQARERFPEGRSTGALRAGTNGYSNPGIPNFQPNNPSQTRPLTPPQSGTLNWYRNAAPSYPQTGTAGLGKRPRRAPDVRDLMSVVTAHNLSRNHRTVLLLADGEHTILDLARLSSKSVDEITGLLADLESRGLVYYYATE